MSLGFLFGGDTGETVASLARKRALSEALMRSATNEGIARDPWEGLGQLARALSGRMGMSAVERGEEASKAYNADLWGKFGSGIDGTPTTASATSPFSADATGPGKAPTGALALKGGIQETADALGIKPVDLATAISYETGGTFDPMKKGPTTQWGQHKGLIQFGEPQAKQYGVDWNDPVGSQLGANGAIAKYLTDAGVKPGMGMMDIYSAINAGHVGRYGASDANNGGAPGTVADKVNNQMAGHRAKAEALFADGGGTQVASLDPAIGMPEPQQVAGLEIGDAYLGGKYQPKPLPETAPVPSTNPLRSKLASALLGQEPVATQAAMAPPVSRKSLAIAEALTGTPSATAADVYAGRAKTGRASDGSTVSRDAQGRIAVTNKFGVTTLQDGGGTVMAGGSEGTEPRRGLFGRLGDALLGRTAEDAPRASNASPAAPMAYGEASQGASAQGVQVADAGGGLSTAQLYQIMSDPRADDSVKGYAQFMLKTQLEREDEQRKLAQERSDPEYQLGLDYKRAQLDALQHPKPDWQTATSGGNTYRWNANDPNAKPELFIDGPDKQEEETYFGNPIAIQTPDGIRYGQIGNRGGFKPIDIGQGNTFAPNTRSVDTGTELLTVGPGGDILERIPKQNRAAEADKAAGKVEGEAQGTAAAGLNNAISQADQSIGLIDVMLEHPGREAATGASSWLDPRNYLAGTDATDFNVRRQQLEGRAFLQAFDSLKGGGQITEVEGQKATAAIARLSTSQSDEAYKEALLELRGILEQGKRRAAERAGVGGPPAPSGNRTSGGIQWSIEP